MQYNTAIMLKITKYSHNYLLEVTIIIIFIIIIRLFNHNIIYNYKCYNIIIYTYIYIAIFKFQLILTILQVYNFD